MTTPGQSELLEELLRLRTLLAEAAEGEGEVAKLRYRLNTLLGAYQRVCAERDELRAAVKP